MTRLVPCSLALLFLPLLSADADTPARQLPPAAARTIDFAQDIKPILTRSCLSCHNAEKHRGGLQLDTRQAALRGGDSGVVLKPGDPSASRLLLLVAGMVKDEIMPPEGKPTLSAQEVGLLRAWIEQGIKWDGSDSSVTQQTRSNHWAFQPIKRPPPPAVQNPGWVGNDLDRFILARLEKEKIEPAGPADRVTLIRRLSLDLLGLPPSIQEVDAFLADTRSDAYERLVDRLLASPHYGERWARHWLDLARYADSDGYEKDTGRPFAWRYRHWLIDALNRDLPYDQFVIEQLAGDLLPSVTVEQKTATGFHRNTLTNKEGGVDQEQFRVEQVVDRVNTTARVFLGLTLGCCQCHDHKYDPFSQREYYQFLAFFNSDVEVNFPAPVPGESEVVRRSLAVHEARRKELQAAVDAYRTRTLPGKLLVWEMALKPADRQALPAAVRDALQVEPAKRTDQQRQVISDAYAKTDTRLTALLKALADHEKKKPTGTLAQTLALGSPRKTHVMIRGDFLRKGVEVEPATPAVLPSLASGGRQPPVAGKPTRLDLARWLVQSDNPLPARVAVNWVWHKYFGRGLVATLEDFGTQGEKPTHPELLDYLASEFQHRKWSLKDLHRLIVTSNTYRQSSRTRSELLQRDPYNTLLARQVRQRLEAEIVRDSCLAASGLLTRTIGGPSVRPPQPAGISELTYAGSARWVESTGPDRYRRGMYIWFQRTSPFPMLMTFDAPDSNVCCVRRERSNTPLQALTLLNDTVFVECAQNLARRILAEKLGSTAERLGFGFRLCVAREPSPIELERLTRLHSELLQLCRSQPGEVSKLAGTAKFASGSPEEAAAWVGLSRALLNLDEFVTRE